jgi:hypothetical protein
VILRVAVFVVVLVLLDAPLWVAFAAGVAIAVGARIADEIAKTRAAIEARPDAEEIEARRLDQVAVRGEWEVR